MEFLIEGKVIVDTIVRVHADDEKSAIGLAKNALKEAYNLSVNGSYHNPDTGVDFELEAFNEADYQG